MTMCGACGAAQQGGLTLCLDCSTKLLGELHEVSGLVADLHTTMSRQDQLGDPYGPRARTAEKPLVFNEGAASAVWLLAGVLSSWAREVMRARGSAVAMHTLIPMRTVNPKDPAALPNAVDLTNLASRLLVDQLDHLRTMDSAGQAFDEMLDAIRQARRAIDRPVARKYIGPCGIEVDEVLCEAELYVLPSATTITCPKCGTVWSVAERHEWLVAHAREHLGTAAEIAGLLTLSGFEVGTSTVRRWAARGELVATSSKWVGDREYPLYRFDDVLDAYREKRERKRPARAG